MVEIDYTQAHVTLFDGTVIQVLDAEGLFDEFATATAVELHLNGGSDDTQSAA